MFSPDRHRRARLRQLPAMLALVAAAGGAGFALGRHPDAVGVARLAAGAAPATAPGSAVVLPTHDESLPDTADTLGRERLRDEDASPSF